MSKGDMATCANPPAGWTLEPGGEEERNTLIKHANPAGKFYRQYSRMRGGSHHAGLRHDALSGIHTA
jgi:hypothetical protein